jgi:hypothetical protein
VKKFHPIDRRGDHRTAAVPAGGQHPDHVHPLEDLPRPQESALVRDVGSDPFVEMRLGSRTVGLQGRNGLRRCTPGKVRVVRIHDA